MEQNEVEDLNRWLHEVVMGNKHWHTYDETGQKGIRVRTCFPCGVKTKNPDYCSDLNAVHEAELKAIEEKGEQVYGQSLFKYVFGYEFTGGAFDGSITVVGALKFAKATAEQRARAIKKCWEPK